MKKLNTILLGSLFVSLLAINSCDPMDDVYLTLALETEFNTEAPVPNVSLTEDFCLSDFDDYNDNSDNINEIKYITAAYFTIDPSNGLQGEFRLRLYRTDTNTLLIDHTDQSFNADSCLNNPLIIDLDQDEIDNINAYLINPKVDKCFRAILDITNASDNDGAPFYLHSKVEFLTEIKVEP